ncbi:MaoC/PaaZ C-terminal domain-containing protein [Natronoglycomyces albus]|uniref:MaoC family dehydratase N-terminal domain-containing protein n=1 Tax=Natronoglycomyces albus TaxID=2811108 RepID=A0A895XR43_9ACTN|nr:MaoC/PaaZ C-terminal domain-containing protein [Natronoglycomyces albus]QSB04740.1 MaoC family dehydratase N-terminal domain-containing protein [Natronoglycomyces albus]
MATLTDFSAGDELFTRSFPIDRADLVEYAKASGDHNPIHQDEAAAKAAGLPNVIAHGMYTMGLASRAVSEWVEQVGLDAQLSDFTARFAKPVVVPADTGAEIVVTAKVRKLHEDGALEINLVVTSGADKVLAPARATLR